MRKLELRFEARAEFLEAIAWYEARRTGLGARFKAEVDRVLARIQATPYGIFFAVNEHEIVVLAVLHHRRDPETWKSRR